MGVQFWTPTTFFLEGILKVYELKKGMPRTLAGIGFFDPKFIAVTDKMVEKIENSIHFKNGSVGEVKNGKIEPIETKKPVDVDVKPSRKALFAQHGEKITSAAHMTIQRIALELGATESEIAGLSRAKLLKLIRERTVE